MRESKGLDVLSYIIIGIVLLPIIAVLLYVIFGVWLFIILYIIARKKCGKMDPKESKDYKIASTVILILGALIMVFGFKINFNLIPDWNFNNINYVGYFCLQLLVFVGLIPLDVFYWKKIKKTKEVD